MSTLRTRLQELAAAFADEVMAALQTTSLQDLIGAKAGSGIPAARTSAKSAQLAFPEAITKSAPPAAKPGRKPGRLPRRSADEIQASLGKIVALLQKHKDGLRAEEIRSNLGMQAKEMPRILKEGLTSKVLRSKGQKRATTYFAK
jgi:hypothetical protein